jgi:hypothetical protein
MKFFLFISLVFIPLLICPVISFADKLPGMIGSDTVSKWEPVFGAGFQKGLYRTSLDISKNHLTGYIFIKKTPDSTYRILFSNDFGMQIFDFEFSENNFIVHFSFPSLDRKSLLKLLNSDFRIILFSNYGLEKIKPVKSDNKEELAFKVKSKIGKWKYRISGSSRKILSIRNTVKGFSKTVIDLNYSSEVVTGISISNPLIKLFIRMTQISQ